MTQETVDLTERLLQVLKNAGVARAEFSRGDGALTGVEFYQMLPAELTEPAAPAPTETDPHIEALQLLAAPRGART